MFLQHIFICSCLRKEQPALQLSVSIDVVLNILDSAVWRLGVKQGLDNTDMCQCIEQSHGLGNVLLPGESRKAAAQ